MINFRKLKEKGLKKVIQIVIWKINDSINQAFIYIFRKFSLINELIVFESEGDYTDNSQALYQYMLDHGYLKKYKVVWLVDNIKNFRKKKQFENTWFCCKQLGSLHIDTSYYLARCQYYIYDHNNLLEHIKKRTGQRIICLWHGGPFKAGTRNSPDMTVDEGYATGTLFKKGSSIFIGCTEHKIYDIGYPRNDYLFQAFNKQQVKFVTRNQLRNYDKVILWMPTFRKSMSHSISENYFKNETGLPILAFEEDLIDFNQQLKELNVFCVFKVHHLQAELPIFKKQYTNLLILKDEMIAKANLQLYQIIPMADILITDYSSIFADFLLLDRPIIFTLDDYEEYRKSRGFIFDNPIQYFAGEHVYNQGELYDAVNRLLNEHDNFLLERRKILPQMHTYTDGNASKRILDHLKIRI